MKNIVNHPYIDAFLHPKNNYYVDKTSSHYFYKKFILQKNDRVILYNNRYYDFFKKTFFYKSEKYIFIFIGNKNKCITARISFNDETKDFSIDANTFGYYEKCEKPNNKNGVVDCFLELIKKYYIEKNKKIKNIILTDDSVIRFPDKKYPIGQYYFYTYGNYYYSDKYGFEPDFDNNFLDRYKNRKKILIKFDKKFIRLYNKYYNCEDKKTIQKEMTKYDNINVFLENFVFKERNTISYLLSIIDSYLFGSNCDNYYYRSMSKNNVFRICL